MADEVRILHAADIHLDSPLRGLDGLAAEQTVQELRRATSSALHSLVDLALQEQPAAVVIAGDLYDGDAKDYQTGRTFIRQMQRLDDADIPVVIIAGNHDAASVITHTLTPPKNVRILSTERPETVPYDNLGLAFHGQGFPDRAVMDNLVANYPKRIPQLINVGLLHTSLAGYEGHDPYAPCTEDDIAATGYEYMAMGHIHKRVDPVIKGRTTAAFSGNLQGRHIRETGPKGAYMVTLTLDGQAQLEFVPLDVARWELVEVDVTKCSDLPEVLEEIEQRLRVVKTDAGKRIVAVRLVLEGESEVAFLLPDREELHEEVKTITERYNIVLNKVVNRVGVPATPRMLSLANRNDLDSAAESSAVADPILRKAFVKLENAISPAVQTNLVPGEDTSVDFATLRRDALNSLITELESGR